MKKVPHVITPKLGFRESGRSGITCAAISTVPDIEVSASLPHEDDQRAVALLLRAWFDSIIDGLAAPALDLIRDQCLRAERSAANVEIVATIDRRLAHLRGGPPRGS